MANAYLMSYAHAQVGFSPKLILSVGLVGGVVALVFSVLGAVRITTKGTWTVVSGSTQKCGRRRIV
jgi:hypothetical protein